MTKPEDKKTPKAEHEHIQDMYKAFKPIAGLAGLFSPKIKEAFKKVESAMTDFEDNQKALIKFAELYGPEGWVAFDGVAAPLIKSVSEQEVKTGEPDLINHFLDKGTLERLGWRFHGDRFREWLTIYETIKDRLEAEDFISAVPLIQIVIDGVCQKHLQMSPFSGGADAVVFGKLVDQDYLVEAFRIHGRTRKKINSEPIDTPYRNGILHGCDTNFGNELTAAKAINLLQATLEYLSARLVETQTIEKAREEQTPPKWRDLANQITRTNAIKKATESWSSRGTIIFVHDGGFEYTPEIQDQTPESAALVFINAMVEKNYGALGGLIANIREHTIGKHIHETKSRLEGFVLNEGRLYQVSDTAAAISKIDIDIQASLFGRDTSGRVELIMNCLNPEGNVQVRGIEPFSWKVHPISLGNLFNPRPLDE
ncbi:MAG: hypothetical protein EX271_05040 [Acidimicrobiales bacterium]|nr:MAG: hypothetical protein EX271_05040 [Acidimicrobiales bacterium]